MMHWGNNGLSGGEYALMSVSMVLFWGLVITGFVLLIRYLAGPAATASRPHANPPEVILAERFARGEIDDEEYRRRLEVLRGRETTTAGK